jgi:hypothetical protein
VDTTTNEGDRLAATVLEFRFLFQALALVTLTGLGGAASAQNMTSSEAAAQSLRPATEAERNRKADECQFRTVPDETRDLVNIDTGIEGRVVYLPPMRCLLLTWIAYQGPEKGTFAIIPPVELPFGGIANFDFCGVMKLIEGDPKVWPHITTVDLSRAHTADDHSLS